jgi:LysM repeat protein
MTFELKDDNLENITGGTIIPYLIEAGDTLAAIAKKFNCTVEELQRWNKIENIDKIDVGQKLVIKY